MPVLNDVLLKELFFIACEENNIPWNFVLANSQTLKLFFDLLKTVKSLRFEDGRFEAIFEWGKFYLKFDDPKISKTVCMKLLSYVTIQFHGDDNGHTLYNITKLPLKNINIPASCLLSQKLENDGNLHTYKSEKQISENKKFKMEASLEKSAKPDQRFPEIDMDYYNFSDIDDEENEDYDDE